MKSTIDDLLGRRSSREYSPRQISDDDLEKILLAGEYAPSARDRQTSLMVVLQDPEAIAELSRMNARIMGTDGDPFYGAPTVIVVLESRNNRNAVADGSLVMGNLMNAAHALGLGSCWVNRAYEEFETDEGKAMLRRWGIPGDHVGIGHCLIGYPLDLPKEASPRRDGRIFRIR